MRTIRYADEVWTPTGIVDSIRFEDYKEKDMSYCSKCTPSNADFKYPNVKYGTCKIDDLEFPNKNCVGCVYKRSGYEIGMCITCFEVKITLADFKSKNGHNFHGNRNYYVVPKSISKQISEIVSDGIGVLYYIEKSGTLRMEKECEFKTVNDEIRWILLYNAMKKWCDGKQN